ncbi:recombinase family protein [Alteribacter keqinensis]|nr:recombinase family protein [Alteribacter keqinensis]
MRGVAIYTRVSTEEQAREGVSLEEQKERLLMYCKALKIEDPMYLFVDEGYSAKSMDRPQLQSLISKVAKNEIKCLLITKLDRLSRNLLDLLTLLKIFREHEVSFISISENFDTSTPSGRLTLQVLGAMAEFERERIRERVIENMEHAARKGKWLTQHPYGYRLKDGTLFIHEEEAEIVREIFDVFVNKGRGYYFIAKELNKRSIPSRYKKQWSNRGVKLVLSNPVYKGTLAWNRTDSSYSTRKLKDEKEWIMLDNELPAIIDKETWNKAQKRINEKPIHSRSQTRPHLLGGLLKCGQCGGGMSISWSGSKNKRYRVYRCSRNKNNGTCTSKGYRADDVEKWFLEGLENLANQLDSEVVVQLSMLERESQKDSEEEVKRLERRYKRKAEAYAEGLIELDDLRKEKRKLNDVKELNTKNKSTKVDLKKYRKEINKAFCKLKYSLESLPVLEAKDLIKLVIEKVIISGEKDIIIQIKV